MKKVLLFIAITLPLLFTSCSSEKIENNPLLGTWEKIAEIDSAIADLSKGWKLSRMPGIDRSILRMAVYELRFMPKARPGIVINEAVELAKRFGTDESGRFINGILGAMVGNK